MASLIPIPSPEPSAEPFVLCCAMECPISAKLLETYSEAAIGYFEAAETLANLIGQHGEFADAKKVAEGKYAECEAAHLALVQHRSQHGCRF